MKEPAHILVVDDDDRIRDLLKRFLTREGHRVTTASDAAAARRLLATMEFDLAILDVMMPGEDGLSLLAAIRAGREKETPVMLLTARGQATDRIEGLKLGADDYLPKPFEPEELALRCAAILRRSHKDVPPEEVEMSGLVFNAARGELREGDKRIRLTDAELQLLTILAANAGEPVSREELASQTSAGMERSVDVQVTRLRRKIEPNPREPVHIQTVRGVGYRLMPD
ncbi:MAG: response regulator transcription factor [Alphaproteobacteria bacterium]|uniref:response regulator transcription factor n=1 Tax=Hyphomonas sp. TaxID=87 RepID=UPI001D29CFFA|nr:response regulator transcription factor [Alphaproteobacteria bacterium]MBU2082460.1 response regulator transcription factor [Alphaproteobacteria bacterium]MBU2141471.1 response regulator transcription factor [Alphaproteobacteria bacterium]MBU2197899.1 response regulator transcription factor [Alphaproteobacteria bacterium]